MKRFSTLLLVCSFFVSACARPQSPEPLVLQDQLISEDTLWSGEVLIDGKVEVLRDATLKIAPGTVIRFVYRDTDRDGLGDGTLIVKGKLLAIGNVDQPISFRSARANPEPGDWLEIAVDFSKQVHLRYCEIRDSAYTLHAHFTRGIVEDSHIHHNIDGCRIGQATFTLRHNLVEQQTGKGINFRNSRVRVENNLIRNNTAGIFLFENDQVFSISGNNLIDNQFHLRLGDFYLNDVSLQGNWWGTADPQVIRTKIYDRKTDPEIGAVQLAPLPSAVVGAGPRKKFKFAPAWRYQTGGFVDAAPLVVSGLILYPSWDGRLHALNGFGRPVWTAELGDIADSIPATDSHRVFLQTWQRQVVALELADGSETWRFSYPESPADDHRQGGLVVAGPHLLVPAWNGNLYALDPASGKLRWEYSAGSVLRAAPLLRQEKIYLPASDGQLHCLDLQGRLLWKTQLGAPLLTTPVALGDTLGQLTKAGELIVLDAAGQEVWRYASAEACFYSAPVAADGSIYFATAGGSVHALDAETGQLQWESRVAGPVYATPRLLAGRLFGGDNAGHLFALSMSSGELLAKIDLQEPVQSQPLIYQGLLLVGARDGAVHAFKADF